MLREILNKYLRWSRSRAKVTAPAPAKYPGSGSETLTGSKIKIFHYYRLLGKPCYLVIGGLFQIDISTAGLAGHGTNRILATATG